MGSSLHGPSGTVLLTGATGFIGPHVARQLGALGVEVVATHRTDTLEGLPVTWVQCDLADGAEVAQVVGDVKPSVILHLASFVAGARTLDLVEPTFSGNLVSTVNLLTSAVEAGVDRVVLAGSLEEPEGDAATAIPSSPYAAAKWAASAYARMFHALYDLDVVTARIFMVYGPGQRDERKLVPYVVNALLDGETPALGPGTRPVDWVYVEDVAAGLIRMTTAPNLSGSRVDLGSGETHTVKDVVLELARLSGDGETPQFGAVGDRAMEQIRVADTEGTRKALNWAPETPLSEGLQATIDWYAAKKGGRVTQ